MHISLQSFVGSITFYWEINKSLNLLSWKRYKCCHSAASWLQPVKNAGKQHQVQYKRTGVYHFSSSLDSLFSAVTSWGINTHTHNFFWIFCWSSHSCGTSLGHPYSPWMLSQCMVPEHQVWHRAAQMSEENLTVWRQARHSHSAEVKCLHEIFDVSNQKWWLVTPNPQQGSDGGLLYLWRVEKFCFRLLLICQMSTSYV